MQVGIMNKINLYIELKGLRKTRSWKKSYCWKITGNKPLVSSLTDTKAFSDLKKKRQLLPQSPCKVKLRKKQPQNHSSQQMLFMGQVLCFVSCLINPHNNPRKWFKLRWSEMPKFRQTSSRVQSWARNRTSGVPALDGTLHLGQQ